MSALNNSEMPWRSRVNYGVVFIALFLVMVLSHAGGLGIAPLVTIVGLIGYVTAKLPKSIRHVPAWFWALGLFVLWALITSLWSPYQDSQPLANPMKLLLGFLIYPGVFLAFRLAATPEQGLLRHMLIAVSVLALGVLLLDLISGYAITYLIDPLAAGEDIVRKAGDTEMNLGHHITVLALFMPVVVAVIILQLPYGRLIAFLFGALVGVAALLGGLSVGLLAIILSGFAIVAAWYSPKNTLRVLTWMMIATVILAPFLGFLMAQVGPELKAQIPFSWEHRVEMWAYTAEQIMQSPVWGHGFDAARTFDGTFSSRGIENWAIVSLHPHNAGLHIWAETGFIGAALASAALLTIGISAEHFCETSRLRSMAIAGFMMAAMVISNVSYGVWQEWWWAILFFVSATIYVLPEQFPER